MQGELDHLAPVDISWTKALPKVELHAHLSGSISRKTLHEIWLTKQSSTNLEDPLIAIPTGKVDYDLATFFPLFGSYIYQLVNDRDSIAYATDAVLKDFEDDGVVYLELRTTPRPKQELNVEEYVNLVLQRITMWNLRPDVKMQTRLILSIDRGMTRAEAEEVVKLAITNQQEGVVVGVDLCGDPSVGDVCLFTNTFMEAKKKARLKVTVHFGEIAKASETELRTILDWQPDRLGHLCHVPESMREEILRLGIGVELCLSCNVHAKMITGTYSDHHFKYWWERNGKIALGTDNVGVFCSPLSEEYRLIGEHFGLFKKELLQLSKTAAEISFLKKDEKDTLLQKIQDFETNRL